MSTLLRRTHALAHRSACTQRCRVRQVVCNARSRPTSVKEATARDASALQTTQLVPTPSQQLCSRDPTQPPCWIPPFIVFGLATLFSAVILKNRKRKPAVTETDALQPVPPSPAQDPRSYQRALAHTRQDAALSKAIAFTRTGEPARAYMELRLALEQNSICRSPMVTGLHTKAEVVELYKLHLLNAEQPPNFATLLQLQEMLGIGKQEAEKIELDVMSTPGAFSI